ncbi:TPR repeat protein [Candidatus Koribacter versatilis Ellin345]|uniref:TPR repeat protein n=1 Tax=Koribacter versatilis (strain Ellin345) TaxID=204669 RepID=Q1IJK9_KORVE|nr:carboxypeptidase-like regulatory domain-containing protein [Candidatus Koribacter versatilis]ABF42941.1 TPR repeat protein [Candidatus Koribacter versatilis Ellin345]
MKPIYLGVLFIAAFAMQLAAQAPASIPKVTDLSVRVVFENGRSAGPNNRVEVLGQYGGSVTSGSTDTSGQVTFPRMDPGNYRLRVSGPGIVTTETPVIDLTDAGPRSNQTVPVKPSGQMGDSAPGATVDANIPADARKEFDKGEDKSQGKDYNAAREHLEKAVTIYPKYAMAYNDLGLVYMHLNQGPKAVEAFKTAAQLDEHLKQANLFLGQFYYENHQFKDAEPYLVHATKDDPKNAQLLLALANSQLRNGQNDEALATAQKVHALPDHKKFAAAHLIAAEVYADKGDNQHAKDEYHVFLKEDSNSPMAPKVKEALAKLEAPAK